MHAPRQLEWYARAPFTAVHSLARPLGVQEKGITIDVAHDVVRVGSWSLRGKWVELYALLALTRLDRATTEEFVLAEQVAGTGAWRNKSLLTIRKEIWAHLERLRDKGLSRLIRVRGKTLAWRLASPPSRVKLLPDRDTVARWLGERAPREVQDEVASAVSVLVEAHADVHKGARTEAREKLARLPASVDASVASWCALVKARAAADGEEGEVFLDQLHRDLSRLTGAVDRSVAARVLTIAEYRRRMDDRGSTQTTLRRLAGQVERRGDVGALAMISNVLGLLAREERRHREAESQHLRAAVLAAVSEDFHTLQGALFNVAHARRARLGEDGKHADATTYGFVDACLSVCDHFGVGADEVQAEVAAAAWAADDGDFDRAAAYLRRAERLIQNIDSIYERACFYAARARVALATGPGSHGAIEDLRKAQRLFEVSGPEGMADWCRERLKSVMGAP